MSTKSYKVFTMTVRERLPISHVTSDVNSSTSTSLHPIHFHHTPSTCTMRVTRRSPIRLALLWHRHRASTLPSPTCQRRAYANDGAARNEAHPFKSYHIDPLNAPLRPAQPPAHPSAPADPIPSERTTAEEAKLAKFRTVFGSGRPDLSDRKRSIEGKSPLVAGVLVPPRPEEPENCCM
ncbi:hypothetical protein LTR33_018075, partial [Friedmanniomyces endolithicus]